ncbi:MAG TPA: acetoin utilization protein AcuC [Acidimicrobiales bacterium]|nr:acetoin utilization protein AcuC [Acidimicrobiales bacterium]
MSDRVELVRSGDTGLLYDHGGGHPLRPERVLLTYRLIDDYGIVDGDRVTDVAARDAADEELALVHATRYVDAVRRAGHGQTAGLWEFGFGLPDNPVFPRMHEASARVVGATLVAAGAVLSGRAQHAFNPSGGLHHAMPAKASGFCVYDDPAVAIAWLLDHGVARVAYVDVDVHHGDGPQAIFYADPRVLTISLHQYGGLFFPGSGAVNETGEGDAAGTSVNVPLPAFTGDDDWLRAFEEVVPPLVQAFRPEILVTQLGCDSHYTDPLANLNLTMSAYRRAGAVLHELAHEVCGGAWVATGGGGYQWARVVPRAWTTYFAEMAGVVLDDELPAAWVERARHEAGVDVPARLGDPPLASPGGDREAVRRTVDRVRKLVFPAHGLR